ncbi:MAG: hypothetical protein ED559_11795 [Phycisphaera sp.]|nr:MAG: hypothetical protein ED559_11795 [Phycisphaera sp.]
MNDPVWSSRVPAPGGITEEQIQTIPASYGVVCVRDTAGKVISLAASGDARSFLAARLGPQAEGANDLRPVAGTYEIMRCLSIFEADLAFIRESAVLDPGLHDRVTRKLRIWWLATHTDASRAEWVWETDPAAFDESMRVIGPFLEKKGVRRHASNLDAAFELCRYPDELHKAPAGRACAYKEMGKCPGACDGSESLGAYELRLAEALAFDASVAEARRGEINERMREAALAEDFEVAAQCKSDLSSWDAFDKRYAGVVADLGMHSYAVVTQGDRAGVAAVLAVDRGRWARACELELEAGEAAAVAASASVLAALGSFRGLQGCGDLGVLGVLGRELLRPSRGGPGFVRIDRLEGSILLQAARRVVKTPRADQPDQRRNAPRDE